MKSILFALLFFGAILSHSLGAATDEAKIAGLYARGLAGDKQAVTDCVVALEQVLLTRPNDQLARVYLGSAYTLRSRDLPFGLEKWDALRHGIALMDAAAAAAPDNARVQLLRAVTCEAFPAILGRQKLARHALEDLVHMIEKDPGKLTPSDQQLLFLNAGEAAKRAGDMQGARKFWERGLALNADARLTAEIRDALKQTGE